VPKKQLVLVLIFLKSANSSLNNNSTLTCSITYVSGVSLDYMNTIFQLQVSSYLSTTNGRQDDDFSRNPSCALNVISTLLLHSVFQLVHYRSFITTANVSQFKFQSMTSTDKAAKMTIYVDCVTIIMLLKLKWNQFSSNLTGRHQFCLSVSTLLWEVIISSL
jgi:hypothetical protein